MDDGRRKKTTVPELPFLSSPVPEAGTGGDVGKGERRERRKAGKAKGGKGTGALPLNPAGGNDSPRTPSDGNAEGSAEPGHGSLCRRQEARQEAERSLEGSAGVVRTAAAVQVCGGG